MPTSAERISGVWNFEEANGALVYYANAGDDYVELRTQAANGLPTGLGQLDGTAVGELSFRSFGQGLGVLRLLPPGDSRRTETASERLTNVISELVETVMPGATWIGERLGIETVVAPFSETTPAIEVGPTEEPAGDAEEAGETIPEWLVAASTAVERGQLGHAEKWATTAPREYTPQAHAFLQHLSVVRQRQRQVRRWPRDPSRRLDLGWAYLATGAYRTAVQEAAEVLRLDPRRGCAHALLGMERLSLGDEEGARAAYAKAQELAAPDDRHVRLLGAALAGEPLDIEELDAGR